MNKDSTHILRLDYFDYFRAIAIILIVAGHSFSLWAIDTLPEKVAANMIKGGTALFVFISGFFFHYIFYQNFKYWRFIKKKINHVLVPYLILSTMGFLVIVIFLEKGVSHSSNLASDVKLYVYYLYTGSLFTAYWYIPFIMLTFALSPIFIKFIELRQGIQLTLFFIFLFIAMLIHRPVANLSPLHSFIYFIPMYLLGILFSVHQEKVLTFLNGKIILLGIAVISLSLLQIKFYGTFGNFHKYDMLSFEGIDIIAVQKIFLIFFIISILQTFFDKRITILKYLASVSFPIFFLHPWVLGFMSYCSLTDYLSFLPGIVIFLVTTSIALIGSILIANIIKLILQKRSIYVVGW